MAYLHLGNTESILFGSCRRLKGNDTIDVNCAGNTITSKSCVKYVGVQLDQTLSGDHIAESIIRKTNAKLKFLYRQTRNVDMETKKLLTSALIQCHFDYASSSWYSGLSKKYKKRMQITQNKTIRFLLNAHGRTHIGPAEFRQVNMLPVELRAKQTKLNHMYNIIQGTAPNYMSSNIRLTSTQHSINTRSGSLSLTLPSVKSFGFHSFHYTGPKAWNELSSQIQCSISKSIFKRNVKLYLQNYMSQEQNNPFIYY